MKFNKIFMLAGIAAALCFSSCDEDEDYKKGEVASGNQLMAVTFGESNIVSEELDPNDATSYEIPVYRENGDEAVSVPLKVITNEGGIFNVPEKVDFAAGSKASSIVVTFDKAEVGTNYALEVAIDESYVNPYASATKKSFAYDVTRVKWNSLGMGYWIDDFWYGFIEEVEIFQRDDVKSAFRFASPYTDDATGGGATYTPWISLNLTNNGYVTWDKVLYINTFNDTYGAELKGYYPSALSSSLAASDELSYAEANEKGGIAYFVVCPYWYMDGVGGYGTDYPCYLVFPGQDLPQIEGAWWLGDDEEEE